MHCNLCEVRFCPFFSSLRWRSEREFGRAMEIGEEEEVVVLLL